MSTDAFPQTTDINKLSAFLRVSAWYERFSSSNWDTRRLDTTKMHSVNSRTMQISFVILAP